MYSYTIYCALFICCAQVFSMEIPDALFDKHALECLDKTNVDKPFLEKHLNDKFHVIKGNEKMNEYLECMGKSKNLVNEDGKLNPTLLHDNIISIMLPLMNKSGDKHEIATKVTDECVNTTGDNYGDRMASLHNCVVDALSKH